MFEALGVTVGQIHDTFAPAINRITRFSARAHQFENGAPHFSLLYLKTFSTGKPTMRITAFLATLLLVAPGSGAADRLTDADLVASSIATEVGTSDAQLLAARVQQARAELEETIRTTPNHKGVATIVFGSGLDDAGVDAFARTYELEVVRAEAKVPVGERNTVHTISIGARELFLLEGTLARRLKSAIGHQRVEFQRMATTTTGVEAEEFRQAAFALPIRFYKIEVIGESHEMAAPAEAGNVAAIFFDDDATKVSSFQQLKTDIVRAKGENPLVRSERRLIEEAVPKK